MQWIITALVGCDNLLHYQDIFRRGKKSELNIQSFFLMVDGLLMLILHELDP